MDPRSNLGKVAPFGQKFGLNLAYLAQYSQIFSFQDRNLNFAPNVHFLELLTNFMSELENVAPFGQKFGPNLANLALYGQIFSFQDRSLKFALDRHFSKLWKNLRSNLEKVAPFCHKLAQYSDYFDT